MTKISCLSFVFLLGLIAPGAFAQSVELMNALDWPQYEFKSLFREARKPALDKEGNWSGAQWNDEDQVLWVCRNQWGVRAFKFDPLLKQFSSYKTFSFKNKEFYDFEAITQENQKKEIFLLVNENAKLLQEFDLSVDGKPKLLNEWNLKKVTNKDEAFEGAAFIENKYLSQNGFTDGEGKPYPKSRHKRRGILLLSEQYSGDLFALDLGENGELDVIGRYNVPLKKTRGLEFVPKTGYLYAVDGSRTAKMKLSAVDEGKKHPSFEVVKIFKGPGPKGAEGIAVVPNLMEKGTTSVFITDDDNLAGKGAVRWYDFGF